MVVWEHTFFSEMPDILYHNINQFLKNNQVPDERSLISLMELPENNQLGRILNLFIENNRLRKTESQLIPKLSFTNHCSRHCLFCTLRQHNKKIKRYRLKPEDIIYLSWQIINMGYRTLILQAGHDVNFPFVQIIQVIENLSKQVDLKLILSAGEFSFDQFAALRRAGLDSCMLSESIADPDLFRRYHPYTSYLHRIRAMEWIHSSGLSVSITNRIGLPYQLANTLYGDAMIFKQIGIDLIALEPFIPGIGTPLEKANPVPLSLMLKMIAICRLLNPDSTITISSEIEQIFEGSIEECIKIGANAISFPLEKFYVIDESGNYKFDMKPMEEMMNQYKLQIESAND